MYTKPLYCGLALLLFSSGLCAEPLFDAHIHYNAADAEYYSPEKILEKLDLSDVGRAAVTSTPTHLARQLHQLAPERIVPLLGVYRNPEDKLHWPQDPGLPSRIETELKQGGWRGIGELHIFANDRHSPVFRRIVELAGEYRLSLLLHTDPAVIDTVYNINPEQPVIWAHAGTFPYPDLLADYLQRYPALSIDLTVRDDRIAPDGELLDDWYELIVTNPDRFMIGVDTYTLSRWHDYEEVATEIRTWTSHLPEDVATRLRFKNAVGMFEGTASSKPIYKAGDD